MPGKGRKASRAFAINLVLSLVLALGALVATALIGSVRDPFWGRALATGAVVLWIHPLIFFAAWTIMEWKRRKYI